MNVGLERMLKEAVVAYFKKLPRYSLEDPEENNTKSQSG
jgi:hypothetical protein